MRGKPCAYQRTYAPTRLRTHAPKHDSRRGDTDVGKRAQKARILPRVRRGRSGPRLSGGSGLCGTATSAPQQFEWTAQFEWTGQFEWTAQLKWTGRLRWTASGALRQRLGSDGEIVAVEYRAEALQDIAALGFADVLVQGDARRPLEVVEQVREACRGRGYQADLTINVVNVPHSEFATILLAKSDGRILFFSMATSFTVAALGAEGMARQVEMHIGNGYMPGHGAVASGSR